MNRDLGCLILYESNYNYCKFDILISIADINIKFYVVPII